MQIIMRLLWPNHKPIIYNCQDAFFYKYPIALVNKVDDLCPEWVDKSSLTLIERFGLKCVSGNTRFLLVTVSALDEMGNVLLHFYYILLSKSFLANWKISSQNIIQSQSSERDHNTLSSASERWHRFH